MPKTPANLSVDPAVMERGKLYGQRHGTSVSQLVGDFLSNLPSEEDRPEFTPAVSLLYGIAARHPERAEAGDPIDAYRRRIEDKYGSK